MARRSTFRSRAAARGRARGRTTTRTTTSTRTIRGGGGAAKYVLPAAVVAGLVYLLWPRKDAIAGQPPVIGPQPPITPPVTPPPQPGIPTEQAVDAPLPAGATRARINTPSGARLRADADVNSATLALLPNGAGVAVSVQASANGPGSAGWWRVRTAGNREGWVAQELLEFATPENPDARTGQSMRRDPIFTSNLFGPGLSGNYYPAPAPPAAMVGQRRFNRFLGR